MLNNLLIFRLILDNVSFILRHTYLVCFNQQTHFMCTQASHKPYQTETPIFGKLLSMQPGKLVIRPVDATQYSYFILRQGEEDEKGYEI